MTTLLIIDPEFESSGKSHFFEQEESPIKSDNNASRSWEFSDFI